MSLEAVAPIINAGVHIPKEAVIQITVRTTSLFKSALIFCLGVGTGGIVASHFIGKDKDQTILDLEKENEKLRIRVEEYVRIRDQQK